MLIIGIIRMPVRIPATIMVLPIYCSNCCGWCFLTMNICSTNGQVRSGSCAEARREKYQWLFPVQEDGSSGASQNSLQHSLSLIWNKVALEGRSS